MPSGLYDAAVPQALILAAGVGKRLAALGPEAHRGPKALLDFAGKSLLQRHVELLRRSGISTITVVTGFEAHSVRTVLEGLPGEPPVCVVVNPAFREGSVVSLWAGRSVLESGTPVILMDADVIYDGRLMARLVQSGKSNVLLLDREIEPGDEPVKLCVKDGQIVDFRKQPTAPHEWYGESVGFFRFTPDAAAELAVRADDYVANGRRMMEYEEPIRDMIMASAADRFGFEDISGLPWTEIDFPEDIVKARALLPELVG
jgi:choline kinase